MLQVSQSQEESLKKQWSKQLIYKLARIWAFWWMGGEAGKKSEILLFFSGKNNVAEKEVWQGGQMNGV